MNPQTIIKCESVMAIIGGSEMEGWSKVVSKDFCSTPAYNSSWYIITKYCLKMFQLKTSINT